MKRGRTGRLQIGRHHRFLHCGWPDQPALEANPEARRVSLPFSGNPRILRPAVDQAAYC
jgi:hypothetical protein